MDDVDREMFEMLTNMGNQNEAGGEMALKQVAAAYDICKGLGMEPEAADMAMYTIEIYKALRVILESSHAETEAGKTGTNLLTAHRIVALINLRVAKAIRERYTSIVEGTADNSKKFPI